MAERNITIDISDAPEILRLVEEVRRVGEPRILRKDGQDLAVVSPLPQSRNKKRRITKPTEADLARFRSVAGSWADVDTDKLIEDIYETRRRSNRPPVEL